MISKTLSTLFFVSLLATSFQTSPFALAQSTFTPQPTWGSASIYIEGKAFYIQSGRPNGNQTWVTQVFYISLNSTWAVTSPAYAPMPNGLDGHVYANTILPDGVTWAAIRNSTYYTYNLSTGTLTPHAPVASYNAAQPVAAVRDPTTGDLIIPAAYRPTPDANATMRFSPTAGTATSLPRFADVDGHQYYTLAASESAKAIYFFGGLVVNDVFATFARLDYGGSAWSLVAAQGQVPTARAVSCMVAAYGGTKLVLMGGEGAGKIVLSDIYIYDVASNTWTKGQDGGATRGRAGHACAASGDNVVVHGGYINISRAPVPEMTSVFSLKTNTWLQAFVPSGPIPSPPDSSSGGGITSPTNDPSGDRPDNGPNIGAIVGGVVAALLVIVVILFWVRHRKRSKEAVRDLGLETDSPVRHTNDPQLYRNHSTKSADGKLAQQMIDRESEQYSESLVLRSPHTTQDPVLGRPEVVVWQSKKLERDITQLVATMQLPPSAARNPQLLRSMSVQANQRTVEPWTEKERDNKK